MSANSRIIRFGYYEHEEFEDGGKQKHRARCRFCKPEAPKLSEFKGITSGFTRHVKRKHKAKWEEYIKDKTSPENAKQTLSTLFLPPSAGCSSRTLSDGESPTVKYKQITENTRQKQVSEAVTKFVIGCNLPLTFVEDKHFQNLLQCLDPRYQPMSTTTMIGRVLPQLRMEGKENCLNLLAQHSNVSLTVDIWTDRAMQSFLSVTAHIVGTNPKTGCYGLISLLLTCQHFHGKHTGEGIAQAFNAVIEDYNIGNKVDYIVTGNAANTKKAFQVKFPVEEGQDAPMGDRDDQEVEDEMLCEELYKEDVTLVHTALQTNSRQKLSCFAHTLQLVVGDGLKDMKCVGHVIAKVTKISSLIHKSTVFKERFEDKFGVGRTITAAVDTRWNSTYNLIKSLLTIEGMECTSLAEVCDTQEFAHALLAHHEWGQLTELCKILEPFAEAITLTQGEQSATICQVVPVILDINSHLRIWKDEARFCKTLVIALQSSLKKHFRGIFINCCMDAESDNNGDIKETGFMDKIYLVSAMLDPQYMLHWIDVDVKVDEDTENTRETLKETLKAGLKELVIMEAERLLTSKKRDEMGQTTANVINHSVGSSYDEDPLAKVPRLLAKYRTMRQYTMSGEKDTVRVQLNKYLRDEEGHGMDAVTFWREDGAAKLKYPSLYILAKTVICVPASSAPVERIFSKEEMIARPDSAQLSPQMLETLMFLKYNEHIL